MNVKKIDSTKIYWLDKEETVKAKLVGLDMPHGFGSIKYTFRVIHGGSGDIVYMDSSLPKTIHEVVESKTWQFTTPIAMKCTEAQFNGIKYRLVDMGYKTKHVTFCSATRYISTCYENESNLISDLNLTAIETSQTKRTILHSFNPDLFLALAAMTDKEEGIKGEWWKSGLTGNLIMQSESTFNYPICRKATAQEIIEHFEKKDQALEKTGYGIFCNLCDAFDKLLIAIEEKEFVLPERWCVYPSEITGKWFDKNHTGSGLSVGYANSNHKYLTWPDIGGSHMFNSIPTGYTKISDAQFKKYVLKETTQSCRKTSVVGSIECTVNVEFDAEKAAEEIFKKVVELGESHQPEFKFAWEPCKEKIEKFENFLGLFDPFINIKNTDKTIIPIPPTKQATLFDDRVEITDWKPEEGETIYVVLGTLSKEQFYYIKRICGKDDIIGFPIGGFIKRTESEAKQLVEKLKQAML